MVFVENWGNGFIIKNNVKVVLSIKIIIVGIIIFDCKLYCKDSIINISV